LSAASASSGTKTYPKPQTVGLDLLAQPRDLDVDRAVEHVVVAAASEQRQLFARERLPRVLREDLDQRELGGREVNGRIPIGKGARREIQRERAERHLAVRFGSARSEPLRVPAQHGMDARNELARVERLRQIVVGPHLEPDDAIHVLAFRGEHHDRHVFAGGAQPSAHGEPVLAGKHEIEHHQMRRVALQLPVEIARVGKRRHLEPLFGQVSRQEIAQTNIVVDHEYLRCGSFCDHGWSVAARRASRAASCNRL